VILRQSIAALDYLRRTPSAGLLLVQLGGLLLYPWMETFPRGRALFGAFGVLVLGVALRVVRRSPALTWVALVLATLVVALSLINVFTPRASLQIATATLQSAFYFYATGSLIAYMLQDWVATTDELFAAGATFTLLAWAFAYAYVACQAMLPGSFGDQRTWLELLFLSVAMLSSVGLSDVLPVVPMARGLVMLEAFAGVMYIALVVSRVVSLTVVRTSRT
jgi:hypothetical protein